MASSGLCHTRLGYRLRHGVVYRPFVAGSRILTQATSRLTVLGVVAIAALIPGACGDSSESSSPSDEQTGGSSVEDITLAALPADGGEEATVGELLADGPLVINFFASWCTPCIEEMPDFETVHQAVGEEVSIVGVATSDGEERALELVDSTGITYPTYGDPDGGVLTYFEAVGMPTTVFITTDGTVAEVHGGKLDADSLRGKLDEHFGVSADA